MTTVYLDSSDYSTLSNPKALTPSLREVLYQLREWTVSGEVTCWFSGLHLSEMAPTDALYASAAERRADLLVEFCGQNALVSIDRIITSELRLAAYGHANDLNVFSTTAEWYPPGVAEVLPMTSPRVAGSIAEAIEESGGNRSARRMAARKSLKRGKVRPEFHATLKSDARVWSLNEMLKRYPMRPEDLRALGRYAVGDVTAAVAMEALLNSLRDPRWMMKWFAQHHDKLTPFTQWTRAPGAAVLRSLGEVIELAATVERGGFAHQVDLASIWHSRLERFASGTAGRLCKSLLGEDATVSSTQVDKHCPSLSVAVRTMHSAMADSLVGATPRKPRASDATDVMHAMYAPPRRCLSRGPIYGEAHREAGRRLQHVGRT